MKVASGLIIGLALMIAVLNPEAAQAWINENRAMFAVAGIFVFLMIVRQWK